MRTRQDLKQFLVISSSSVHLPSNFYSLALLADILAPGAIAMAPNIPSAKITLSCPLFGADFDPEDSRLLVVGGGGGEGRSGVGNKIVSRLLVCWDTALISTAK